MRLSVIIRTKNEASWIGRCLHAVSLQRWPDVEVIVVDNASTDATVGMVAGFGYRLLSISEADYTHGRALNLGIEAATGECVAILSGHCMPVNDRWLSWLALHFRTALVAGVYGRQEPMHDSHAFDKRDLWTTFGLDRRVQVRDFFFHNANSMIRRSVWQQTPFNETIDGVEDRDWAKRVQAAGHTIVYEPRASIFHHHGIHQGRDEARATRVARVIELINDERVI